MDQSQIFSRRAYVFQGKEEEAQIGEEFIKKIFLNLDNPINIINSSLIDATPSYDVYKASSQTKNYQLKLSFADSCPVLQRESHALSRVKNLVCPTYIQNGKLKIGEDIIFSVSSHEAASAISSVGRGVLIQGFSSFCDTYKKLQQNEKPQNNFIECVGDIFELGELEKNFIEEAVESMDNHTGKNKVYELFFDIKKEATSIYDPSIFDKNDFCHGNLTIYNIIERGGLFKLINLDYAHRGNFLTDLSRLMLSLGIKGNAKTQLIRLFCEKTGLAFNPKEYELCEKMNALITLHQLSMDYLYEVYMFNSTRELKICNLINDYAQNFADFCRLPFFEKYKQFISQTIMEPIVGIKYQ